MKRKTRGQTPESLRILQRRALMRSRNWLEKAIDYDDAARLLERKRDEAFGIPPFPPRELADLLAEEEHIDDEAEHIDPQAIDQGGAQQ